MELLEARDALMKTIEEYSTKISKFGTKISANVYFVDDIGFLECESDDKNIGALCGSITLMASDAEDERGMCGFDIVVDIKRHKTIDDKAFERTLEDFRTVADDFSERFEKAPDKDEFIKSESELQKKHYADEMKKFEGDMKRVETYIIIGVCAVAVLVVIAAVSSLLFG